MSPLTSHIGYWVRVENRTFFVCSFFILHTHTHTLSFYFISLQKNASNILWSHIEASSRLSRFFPKLRNTEAEVHMVAWVAFLHTDGELALAWGER